MKWEREREQKMNQTWHRKKFKSAGKFRKQGLKRDSVKNIKTKNFKAKRGQFRKSKRGRQ